MLKSPPTHASRRRPQHCQPLSRPQRERRTTRMARFFGDESGSSAAQHPARSRASRGALKYVFVLFGAAFGFILSRAGATTYDFYAKLFLFQDLQLMWVIGTAATVGAIGVLVMKRWLQSATITGEPISFSGKPYKKGLIPGSLLFGIGWGIAGACPGTALAMLGEGKLGSLFTVAGLLLGTYIYGVIESRKLSQG